MWRPCPLVTAGRTGDQVLGLGGGQETGLLQQGVEASAPAAWAAGGGGCTGPRGATRPPRPNAGEHIGEGGVDPGGRRQAADVLGERLVEQAHHRLLAGTGHLEQVRGGGVQQPVQLGRRDRTAAVGAGQISPQAVAGQARTAGVGDRDEQFGRARRIGKPLQVVVHRGADGVGKRLALLPPRHGGIDHGEVPRPGPGPPGR